MQSQQFFQFNHMMDDLKKFVLTFADEYRMEHKSRMRVGSWRRRHWLMPTLDIDAMKQTVHHIYISSYLLSLLLVRLTCWRLRSSWPAPFQLYWRPSFFLLGPQPQGGDDEMAKRWAQQFIVVPVVEFYIFQSIQIFYYYYLWCYYNASLYFGD